MKIKLENPPGFVKVDNNVKFASLKALTVFGLGGHVYMKIGFGRTDNAIILHNCVNGSGGVTVSFGDEQTIKKLYSNATLYIGELDV